jgi:hypothetical protein
MYESAAEVYSCAQGKPFAMLAHGKALRFLAKETVNLSLQTKAMFSSDSTGTLSLRFGPDVQKTSILAAVYAKPIDPRLRLLVG